MFPFKTQGPFKDTMVKCLQILKSHKDVLTAALTIFIQEPLMDWYTLADIGGISRNEYATKKMAVVNSKLSGRHPVKILIEELRHGRKHKNCLSKVSR